MRLVKQIQGWMFGVRHKPDARARQTGNYKKTALGQFQGWMPRIGRYLQYGALLAGRHDGLLVAGRAETKSQNR